MKPAGSPSSNSPSEPPRCLLLTIGCNAYDFVAPLGAAELDAERVHLSLTTGPAALYDAATSKLLRSPRKVEIDAALAEIVTNHKGLDIFALYFAGHGQTQDGSFYLCPRDVSLDAVSMTAVNFSSVLRAISELRPQNHAYIIVDACFSGSASLDLTSVLKPEIIARPPSFGLTVWASADLTKEATEDNAGGVFTQGL